MLEKNKKEKTKKSKTHFFLIIILTVIILIETSITLSSCSLEKNIIKNNINNKNNSTNTTQNNQNNNSNFVKIDETVNTILQKYLYNKKEFALYDPYKKTLYYGFKITKNNPCIVVLTEDKLESLKKNIVVVNVTTKENKNPCIQILKEEYVFRKSIFLQKPEIIKVYYNNTLLFQKNITILNLSYKNIDSYEKLNSLCQNYPESERAKCCEENSNNLIRIQCVGTWIWEDGCKYKCGITPVR